jgi:hypothetical protein
MQRSAFGCALLGVTAVAIIAVPATASLRATSIIGRWERVNTCQELVSALKQAGLGATAPAVLQGNGYVSGSVQQIARRKNVCQGAVPRRHSHFFAAAGQFGSVDWRNMQVDDGHYRTSGQTLRIGKGTFRYRISDGRLSLTPVISAELKRQALGIDDRPVETEHEDAKSYSQQETFGHDIREPAEIVRVLKRMMDELLPKIREDGKRVRTLTVKVRYPDFQQMSHARSLAEASDLESAFYPLIEPLLRAAWKQRRPLRLVSAKFSGVEDRPVQLEMFGEAEEKRRRLAGVLDRLNQGGRASVVQHGHQLPRRSR